ncbi:hypothetical protein GMMP13_600003 [Candidatus Magnetomoraceae bacterium gMMP-13]
MPETVQEEKQPQEPEKKTEPKPAPSEIKIPEPAKTKPPEPQKKAEPAKIKPPEPQKKAEPEKIKPPEPQKKAEPAKIKPPEPQKKAEPEKSNQSKSEESFNQSPKAEPPVAVPVKPPEPQKTESTPPKTISKAIESSHEPESAKIKAPSVLNKKDLKSQDITKPEYIAQEKSVVETDTKKKSKQSSPVLSLSDDEFVALDELRDNIKNQAKSFQKDEKGAYGWGLVGDYEHPDMPVRTLGGIPFAIDEKGGNYYRISPSEKEVRAIMTLSPYGSTGIEAHDSRLLPLVKKAVRKGDIYTRPENLSFSYLLSKNTEGYVLGKVFNAFEWFIKSSGYNSLQAEDFRKNARLRLDVWQVLRSGSGEMGVAIPIYFDYKEEKLFMPQAYYQNDAETVQLNLSIDQSRY